MDIKIIKKDGTIAEFNPDKIKSAVTKSAARVLVEFNKMPKYASEARFMTYPKDVRAGFLFNRQAELTSVDGKETFARLSSIWAILDAKSRKLVMRPNLPIIEEEHPNPLEEPGKVVPKESTYLFSKVVRYSDCDLNKHLNNVKYVDLIIDINPMSFYERNMISRLLINYNHEIHDGEKLDIYVNEDKTFVEGKVNDTSCFVAEVSYKSRVGD